MSKNSLGILLFVLGLLSSCVSHDTVSPKTQLKNDIALLQAFVAGYDAKAQKTDEGIWYTIDTVGLGIYPVLSDSVNIEYSISSISGNTVTYLYSSTDIKPKTPFNLLSSVIAGLQIGVQRFPVGSYGRLYVPSGLAFGTAGNDTIGFNAIGAKPIGRNANLLIKIKLIKTKGIHFTTDTTAVAKFVSPIATALLAKNIEVKKDSTGILYWYPNHNIGAPQPDLVSHPIIDVTYTAKILNTDTTHFANKKDVIHINLNDRTDLRVTTAWKIILPKISEGDTVTMYVPSGYGYGGVLKPTSTTEIPVKENSNLIYEVKLVKVY